MPEKLPHCIRVRNLNYPRKVGSLPKLDFKNGTTCIKTWIFYRAEKEKEIKHAVRSVLPSAPVISFNLSSLPASHYTVQVCENVQ